MTTNIDARALCEAVCAVALRHALTVRELGNHLCRALIWEDQVIGWELKHEIVAEYRRRVA